MSILSDKEIRRLSTLPNFVISRKVPSTQNPSHGTYMMPYTVTEFSWQSEKEIKDEICQTNRQKNFGAEVIGIYEYRPLNDQEIDSFLPMITPFEPELVRERSVIDLEFGMPLGEKEKIVSYGTSSYGYDIRCGREFKIFTNINSTIVDPKNFDEKNYVEHIGDYCIIPPNSFALARTVEYFRIPRDVLTVCLGKSTYARCGIIVNVTPFEPEWEGYVTLEFSNTTPLPAKIYAGEGCAQVIFFKADQECETSYKDRNGKYMFQSAEPVVPKL